MFIVSKPWGVLMFSIFVSEKPLWFLPRDQGDALARAGPDLTSQLSGPRMADLSHENWFYQREYEKLIIHLLSIGDI
jgi:hypothetical protein